MAIIALCELGKTELDYLETFSSSCLKVKRALAYAGLEYVSRHGQTPADFKALNPARQVPILLVGDEIVCDSTNIVDRIEELIPGVFSKGMDRSTIAEAWLWEEMADSALSGFGIAAAWCDDRNWPSVAAAYFRDAPWFVRKLVAPLIRKSNRKLLVARDFLRAGDQACWDRFLHTLDKLEARAPDAGFWVGKTISRADLAIFGQLQSLRAPHLLWQKEQVTSRPGLTTYLDRVDAATRSGDPVAQIRR
jgi:glutathione S-transferase